MTVQIKIENFQNIESLSLRVEGFCVLVGESNIGKSSVVRALRCLTENTPAKSFMRGKDPAKVQVAFSAPVAATLQDGSLAKVVLVEWERDKSVSYKITKVSADGRKEMEPFERVGRGAPDPVTALRLLRVDTEELQALIGLIPQGRYFWPLDDPHSIVKLIGELRSVVALNTALNSAKAERRGAKKERDFHERAAADAKAALSRFKGSEGLDGLFSDVEKLDQQWREAGKNLGVLVSFRDRLRQIKETYTPIKQEIAHLAGAGKLPALLEVVEASGTAHQIAGQKAASYRSLLARVRTAEAGIKPVPAVEVPDITGIEAAQERAQLLRSLQERVQQAQNAVRPVPSILIPSLERVEAAVAKFSTLQTVQIDLTMAEQRLEGLVEEQRRLEEEHERLHDEFRIFQQENPNCPLCGSALNEVGFDAL